MQTVESLRHQLRTVDELRSVVRTMKGLASSRIHRYEAAASSLAASTRCIELGLQVLLRERAAPPATSDATGGGAVAMIVIGSDQGLCGPFNRRVVAHATRRLEATTPAPPGRIVAAVGQRTAAELDALGWRVDEEPPLPTSLAGVTGTVRDLLLRIDRWTTESGVTSVLVTHNQPVSRVTYEPRTVTVLPLDPDRLRRLRERPWTGPSLPRRFGPWEEVFRHLVRQDLAIALFRAIATSLAAENGARLAAMQAAERAIDERREEIERRYHHRRQADITAELLDVVSGWEVLQHP